MVWSDRGGVAGSDGGGGPGFGVESEASGNDDDDDDVEGGAAASESSGSESDEFTAKNFETMLNLTFDSLFERRFTRFEAKLGSWAGKLDARLCAIEGLLTGRALTEDIEKQARMIDLGMIDVIFFEQA